MPHILAHQTIKSEVLSSSNLISLCESNLTRTQPSSRKSSTRSSKKCVCRFFNKTRNKSRSTDKTRWKILERGKRKPRNIWLLKRKTCRGGSSNSRLILTSPSLKSNSLSGMSGEESRKKQENVLIKLSKKDLKTRRRKRNNVEIDWSNHSKRICSRWSTKPTRKELTSSRSK